MSATLLSGPTILRGSTLSLFCRKCGKERAIATGSIASELSAVRILESAGRIGWKVLNSDRAVCNKCLGKPLKPKKKRRSKDF